MLEEVPEKIPDVHFFRGVMRFLGMQYFGCSASFMMRTYHKEHTKRKEIYHSSKMLFVKALLVLYQSLYLALRGMILLAVVD